VSASVRSGDQRDIDGVCDARRLLQLLHLGEDAVIGDAVVEGAAGVAAEVGRLEADLLDDAGGHDAVGIRGDKRLAGFEQGAQCCCFVGHVGAPFL